jgi:hypothetical protein
VSSPTLLRRENLKRAPEEQRWLDLVCLLRGFEEQRSAER